MDVNKTPALNEAAISQSQLVRFIPDRTLGGLIQKLGGWAKYPSSTVSFIGSIVRSLWAWEDTNNRSYLAVGAEGLASGGGKTLQVITPSSTPQDITPKTLTVSNIVPNIQTSYGTNIVTVTDTGRSITSNDSVYIKTPISVGGLVLFGLYQCSNLGGSINQYTITATTNAPLPANVISAAGSAGTATITYNGTYQFAVGESVVISGMTGGAAGYNGTYAVTASSPGSVSYLNATTGAAAGGATVSNYLAPITVTGASGTGSVATLTYTGDKIQVGQTILVSGMTPTSYNGIYTVTASASGSVSYASTSTGFTTGGTIECPIVVPKFTTTLGSNNITVTLNDHGYYVGDSFPVLIPTSVGGLSLSGNYVVTQKLSSSQFVITSLFSASSAATSYQNSGNAWYEYYKGQDPSLPGFGYGINGYGAGPSGVGSTGYGGTITNPVASAYPGTPINAVDWTLDNWGENLISCPLNGPIYEWSPTQGQLISVVIPQAPPVNEGMFVAMPQRQIIAWGTTFSGVKDPLLIRWCDVDDYNAWTVTPTNQAGYYRIPKGSKIVQGIQAGQQGLIWTDLGIWAMQYVGLPYVYQFNELGTGCGLIGRKAAGTVSGVVYWMGASQFYRLSGEGVQPIKCPIWDVVFQDLDMSNTDSIRIAPNSRFGEISWHYPTNGTKTVTSIVGDGTNVTVTFNDVGTMVIGSKVTLSGVNPSIYNGSYVVKASSVGSVTFASTLTTPKYISGGSLSGSFENSAYIKYNYILDQWDYGSDSSANPYVSRSAWINESVLGPPIGAGLNTYIYQHEVSPNADGSGMNSSFQTGYFALTEADVLMFIDQVWPDMKWGYFGGTQSANILLTFYVASYPGETPIAYGPFNLTQATTYITPRFRGRLVSIKIESSDVDTWWRLGNIRYRIQQDGKFL